MTFHFIFVHIILFGSGFCVTTYWERTAHSADNMFSLHFDYLQVLLSEGGILVLITPVSGHCLLVT